MTKQEQVKAIFIDEAGEIVGPGPKELVCLGLGACAGTNLVSLMKKMRQKVNRIEVSVEAEQAEVATEVFRRPLEPGQQVRIIE